MAMVVIPALVVLVATMAEAQYGGGSCDWSQCRYDRYLAQRCCSSSGTCCDFANGGGNYNGGGYNNNNKPGNCPPYNGRKKRSPRGRFPGNNGYNNGGQGYNPGYNNGGYNPGYNNNNGGSCIRDSDCSADLKCCYLRSGYQCARPNYYG